VADDTPEGLKARSPIHGALRCTIRGIGGDQGVTELGSIEGVGNVEILEQEDGIVVFRIFHKEKVAPPVEQVIKFCIEKKYMVKSIMVEEGHLDEVFQIITTSVDHEAGK